MWIIKTIVTIFLFVLWGVGMIILIIPCILTWNWDAPYLGWCGEHLNRLYDEIITGE